MTAVPILLYHCISDDPPAWIRPFSVTPRMFRRHLDLIVETGATVLRVSDHVAAMAALESPPRPVVLITFDDGLADFDSEALPALDNAGLPATLYVTTGFLDDAARPAGARPDGAWLDSRAVADLHAHGIEIGAHSHTHPHLDTLSATDAHDEIARPKGILEEILGAPVRSFAYPHGFSSRSIRTQVRECGYTSACAVRNALSHPSDDPFALARMTIRSDTSLAELEEWLHGRGAPSASRREHVRTRAWRVYRRGRAVVRRQPGRDW
jgi:peptidoglycan/xylan/chitin deacetylase (PgdA/CDA1 family)